jgi:hypothetical protein
MGFEYRLSFSDPSWYVANRERLAARLRALDRFVEEVPPNELRLVDGSVDNSWSYDMRIFLAPTCVDIEVSGFTATFHVDLRETIDWIRTQTPVTLVDDDGDPFVFE